MNRTTLLPLKVQQARAQVTLIKGDLLRISAAIQLLHATVRNVKQNLLFAFLYYALRLR